MKRDSERYKEGQIERDTQAESQRKRYREIDRGRERDREIPGSPPKLLQFGF